MRFVPAYHKLTISSLAMTFRPYTSIVIMGISKQPVVRLIQTFLVFGLE